MKSFKLNKVFGGNNFYQNPTTINEYFDSVKNKWIKSSNDIFNNPITDEDLYKMDSLNITEFNCTCFDKKNKKHDVDFSLSDFIDVE